MINSKKRILLIGNSQLVIFKFRKELVQNLIDKGYDVWVSFPNGPFGEGEKSSKEFNCNFIEISMDRRGSNPLLDLKTFFQYIKIFRKINPDIVLGFTVKPDIYGGIACRILNIPFIANITGLGKGLSEQGIIQIITKFLYKLALKKAKCVFFQNEEDKKFFINNKIECENYQLLPGSGVNLNEFIPLEYPKEEVIKFIYIARVMKAKGIDYYLEAAKYIKSKYNNIEFHICGYCEEDYKDILNEFQRNEIIIYHGLVNNISDYIKDVHCIVLPTFHPEGISNVLLEGAALERPLITTNRAGCREVVDDEITGFLINERDTEDLINKLEKFIKLPRDKKIKMGQLGRKKVEKSFSRTIVIESYLKEINNIIK